jgi:hypothetical protein
MCFTIQTTYQSIRTVLIFIHIVGEFRCVEQGTYLFCDWIAFAFNLPVRDPLIPLPSVEQNNLHLDVE